MRITKDTLSLPTAEYLVWARPLKKILPCAHNNLNTGITDDTGRIRAPKVLRTMQTKLAKAQQALALTTPDPKHNMTALRRIQKLPGQVKAERKRRLTELVGRFDKIVIENLNVKTMSKNKKDKNGKKVFSFGASVGDNGWGMFRGTVRN